MVYAKYFQNYLFLTRNKYNVTSNLNHNWMDGGTQTNGRTDIKTDEWTDGRIY